jgi:hypothetical protein
MANQAKIKSCNSTSRYKYGYEIPRNFDHVMMLDAKNKNTRWKEAIDLEFSQINEYDTVLDNMHHSKSVTPNGYKKIRIHLVFAGKHDETHKARRFADGHLTEVPLDSVYSAVVSIRGFRLKLFLAALNNLELWSTGKRVLGSLHRLESVYHCWS